MIKIPFECPRGRSDCRSLALIQSDSEETFFCCGENDGQMTPVAQDIYTSCFKGSDRDDMVFLDKLDVTHQSAVLVQALAVVQAAHGDDQDWSAWD